MSQAMCAHRLCTRAVLGADSTDQQAHEAQNTMFLSGTDRNGSHFPEYNMQHELVLDASGKGEFSPRFSYHEMLLACAALQ